MDVAAAAATGHRPPRTPSENEIIYCYSLNNCQFMDNPSKLLLVNLGFRSCFFGNVVRAFVNFMFVYTGNFPMSPQRIVQKEFITKPCLLRSFRITEVVFNNMSNKTWQVSKMCWHVFEKCTRSFSDFQTYFCVWETCGQISENNY